MRVSRQALLSAVLTAAGMVVPAQAVMTVDIPLSDFCIEVQKRSTDGVCRVGRSQVHTGMRIGYQSSYFSNGGGIGSVMFFALPAMPAGQKIGGASLSFDLLMEGSLGTIPTFGADLYALGVDPGHAYAGSDPKYAGTMVPYSEDDVFATNAAAQDSVSVAQAYFYAGALQSGNVTVQPSGPSAPVALIQDNMLQPGDWLSPDSEVLGVRRSTTPDANHPADGDAALAHYLDGVYDSASFQAGSYLILRLNPDAVHEVNPVSSTKRYQIPYALTGSFNPVLAGMKVPTLTLKFVDATVTPGDFDEDGDVDLDDLGLWSSNFTGSLDAGAGGKISAQGDADGDADVDPDDLGIWSLSYTGPLASAPGSAVPEPAMGGLAVLVGLTVLRRGR